GSSSRPVAVAMEVNLPPYFGVARAGVGDGTLAAPAGPDVAGGLVAPAAGAVGGALAAAQPAAPQAAMPSAPTPAPRITPRRLSRRPRRSIPVIVPSSQSMPRSRGDTPESVGRPRAA